MMIEGRLRRTLRNRWPLLHRMVAAHRTDGEREEITIARDTFELNAAQTLLFLTKEGENAIRPEVDDANSSSRENFILEIILEKTGVNEGDSPRLENKLAAIWWVRSDNLVWIQAFGYEQRGAEDGSVVALKGSLFAFSPTSGAWIPSDHPINCDCGRPEVHEKLRQLASVLVHAYLTTTQKQEVVISRRKYPIVALSGGDA